jgi:uncharacterized damage-inducible protein DinB
MSLTSGDTMRDYFTRLIQAMVWADERAIGAIRAAPNADAVRLLARVLGAVEVWLSRLEGRAPALAVWPEITLDQCAEFAGRNAAGWLAFVGRQDDWGKIIRYRNQAGTEYKTALSDIVTHVVIHGAYHRGQVARALGQASAPTDFILFVRERAGQ